MQKYAWLADLILFSFASGQGVSVAFIVCEDHFSDLEESESIFYHVRPLRERRLALQEQDAGGENGCGFIFLEIVCLYNLQIGGNHPAIF